MKNHKIEMFVKSCEGVKFTPAQKKVVYLLSIGYEIQVVNRHRQNGGEWMWKTPFSSSLAHPGTVYKAFFNIFDQIKIQKGIDVDYTLFYNN